jgi:hypothetical protein
MSRALPEVTQENRPRRSGLIRRKGEKESETWLRGRQEGTAADPGKATSDAQPATI